jgi:hypothetical protein
MDKVWWYTGSSLAAIHPIIGRQRGWSTGARERREQGSKGARDGARDGRSEGAREVARERGRMGEDRGRGRAGERVSG